MTLKELEIGKSAVIKVVGGEGALRQHFLDMGVIPGAEVTVIKFAPMGDPMELQIHGYELTLRLSDAEQIEIELISERSRRHEGAKNINQSVHPGLGEEGKYHVKGDGRPLPEQEKLTYALVGNQNCGKTTLFNQLTGSNQHIGNFPGVTVDRKDGAIKGHPNTSVTDLPGIYSMSPYSSEEIVSRNFVLDDKPKAMINIIDATNIERNLYLTMQLLEMDIPMVIALNMMDEMTGNSGSVDVNGMEAMLGVPVVPISAAKNEGVDELVRHALHIAKYQERPGRQDFCDESDCGFKVGHTVAKVPLSEAIIKELLETGKTKEKVTGFNSKAGNVFDSCLKYEDERISFDFDNPGSLSLQKQESEKQSEVQMAVQENETEKQQPQKAEQTPDGADDFYATMADEAAAFQEQEEAEWIAGSNFLDEFMP